MDPQGQATDIAIQAEEIIKIKKVCNQILSHHSKRPIEEIGQFILYHSYSNHLVNNLS